MPTGEFILGYLNHYGLIASGPVVPRALDVSARCRHTKPVPPYADLADLGRHGTFVVYRKLQQDVAGFWQFMRDEAARRRAQDVDARAVALAAKCVGRWPSGAPLMLEPPRRTRPDWNDRIRSDTPAIHTDSACPIGAHIRRTHPRDDLKPYPPQQSLSMSEAHRLLRRARVYGARRVRPEPTGGTHRRRPRGTLARRRQPRGIHFFCVNASIKSQFEFVQQSWCNNPHFGGLYDNKDPIIGDHRGDGQAPSFMEIPNATSVDRLAHCPASSPSELAPTSSCRVSAR